MNFLLETDAPALPLRWLMQWALSLGWGVVLAWLGVLALDRFIAPLSNRRALRLGLVAILVAACLMPGPVSPAYWLGLAFQSPSVVAVLLCAVLLHRRITEQVITDAVVRSSRNSLFAFALMGAVLGWLLLLDTFALLPLQLQVYSLGFSPAAVALVALATLLPWALSLRGPLDPVAWTPPAAVALYVLLRLPTGNVWDAVLDPWLWVVLQVVVVRRWRGRA